MGDLRRYGISTITTNNKDQQQQKQEETNNAIWNGARVRYLQAWHISPSYGNPYNQLAVLASYQPHSSEILRAVYYNLRAISSSELPFSVGGGNLLATLERARKAYTKLNNNGNDSSNDGKNKSSNDGKKKNVIRFGYTKRRNINTTMSRGARSAELLIQELNTRMSRVVGLLFTKIDVDEFPVYLKDTMTDVDDLVGRLRQVVGSSNKGGGGGNDNGRGGNDTATTTAAAAAAAATAAMIRKRTSAAGAVLTNTYGAGQPDTLLTVAACALYCHHDLVLQQQQREGGMSLVAIEVTLLHAHTLILSLGNKLASTAFKLRLGTSFKARNSSIMMALNVILKYLTSSPPDVSRTDKIKKNSSGVVVEEEAPPPPPPPPPLTTRAFYSASKRQPGDDYSLFQHVQFWEMVTQLIIALDDGRTLHKMRLNLLQLIKDNNIHIDNNNNISSSDHSKPQQPTPSSYAFGDTTTMSVMLEAILLPEDCILTDFAPLQSRAAAAAGGGGGGGGEVNMTDEDVSNPDDGGWEYKLSSSLASAIDIHTTNNSISNNNRVVVYGEEMVGWVRVCQIVDRLKRLGVAADMWLKSLHHDGGGGAGQGESTVVVVDSVLRSAVEAFSGRANKAFTSSRGNVGNDAGRHKIRKNNNPMDDHTRNNSSSSSSSSSEEEKEEDDEEPEPMDTDDDDDDEMELSDEEIVYIPTGKHQHQKSKVRGRGRDRGVDDDLEETANAVAASALGGDGGGGYFLPALGLRSLLGEEDEDEED